MQKRSSIILGLSILIFSASSCKKDEEAPEKTINTIPEFYQAGPESAYGANLPEIQEIASGQSAILRPTDLDFHPTRVNELWVLNQGVAQTGGSTVTITGAGTSTQKAEYRQDGNAWHFMSMATALSFSNNGNWGTSAGIQDANHSNGTFTGPSLWSSDMSIYAKPSGGNGSHLDMLHSSPYGMGIESERDNIFWVYDGYNQNIVRYDFVEDHGPGASYHGDGKVWRYTDFILKKLDNIPSHLKLDAEKKWLYIVDGGNQRVLRLNIQSGSKKRDLQLFNEQLAEYLEMHNAEWEEVIGPNAGLKQPCGIELVDNRLFIGDYQTGEIICFDLNTKAELARVYTGDDGITGLKIGPDGKIWFTNFKKHHVSRLNPR